MMEQSSLKPGLSSGFSHQHRAIMEKLQKVAKVDVKLKNLLDFEPETYLSGEQAAF